MRFQDGVGETTCLSQKEECNRMYTLHYDSPLGGILLAADEAGLTGLWFEGENISPISLARNSRSERRLPYKWQSAGWMSISAAGSRILPHRSTPLGRRSGGPWELLLQIPYGQTTTYGALAKQLAAKQGKTRMSAQAVGGAVGHNEISIIIPCHRVVGTDGSLTGYAGGIEKKKCACCSWSMWT